METIKNDISFSYFTKDFESVPNLINRLIKEFDKRGYICNLYAYGPDPNPYIDLLGWICCHNSYREILVIYLSDSYKKLLMDIPEGFRRHIIIISENDLTIADLSLLNYYNCKADELEELIRIVDSIDFSAGTSVVCFSCRNSYKDKSVYLGAGIPSSMKIGEQYTVQIAAYIARYRNEMARIIKSETSSNHFIMNFDHCQWHSGITVKIRLSGIGIQTMPIEQQFKWNGQWQVCRFDINPIEERPKYTLKVDVLVNELVIGRLRPEILNNNRPVSNNIKWIEENAIATAFASYAREDRKEVLGRIATAKICGIDVFIDCLSIRPGEKWKDVLIKEIKDRNMFWLFWSRRAAKSEYVKWEYKTALRVKNIESIYPHPLEPPELAPPPKELSGLQFGSALEAYMLYCDNKGI